MKLVRNKRIWPFLITALFGCGTVQPVSTPIPRTEPIPQAEEGAANPSTGPWSFTHALGTDTYRVSRSVIIEGRQDSTTHQENSNNFTQETVKLETIDGSLKFTAIIDTFATTNQGLIGTAGPAELPFQLSGEIGADGLIISGLSPIDSCRPLTLMLATDLQNLLTRFPAQLSSGMSWTDSLDTVGCQAAISTKAHSASMYTVSGEIIHEGQPMVVVQRTDTIQAYGEGAQGQHRILLAGSGNGKATYYLDTTAGKVIRLITEQKLLITITASGQPHQFTQSSKQEFQVIRLIHQP